MVEHKTVNDLNRRVQQAILVWFIFILLNLMLNRAIPLLVGVDQLTWTYSMVKDILIHLLIYGGLFLVAPLILTKGWESARQPGFIFPLLIAVLALTLRPLAHPAAAVVVVVLAYLHGRYNLDDLGIRSHGWRGDLIAILLLGALSLSATLLRPPPHTITAGDAIMAGLDRLFANPASTVENLFYFGFLAERLSYKTGRWTAPLVGLMYTVHEMSNPEYWYENMNFVFTFVGVTAFTAIYLWRRSTVVIWLSDGLNRFLQSLI